MRRGVRVRGVVQGVGFRPFVYRSAQECGLAGFIRNDSDGVWIEVEGEAGQIDGFLHRLESELPPLARIDGCEVSELQSGADPLLARGFAIRHSEALGHTATTIPADAATCEACVRELFDAEDRRYRYPFLNCTHCGPRFTITARIPYDRPQTSMAGFALCEECRREYEDPADRRFHAQPVACAKCGPRLWMSDAAGREMECGDVVAAAIERLLAGEIAAIKGIGGFHLAVDARNEAAVVRLRERKHRVGKPLAVMLPRLDAVRGVAAISEVEARMLQSTARPIVLVKRCTDAEIAESVAPGLRQLGVFLPYAPLHHLLLADERLQALVMTSANLSEEPICIANDEAVERLGGIADFFLLHDREILQRCDDSVVAEVAGAEQLVRRARGYVPQSVALPWEVAPMLAVGGHLKNCFALARGKWAYQSQHLGDLESPVALEFFEESLGHFLRSFELEPQVVVRDAHPGYLSTRWVEEFAQKRGLKTVAVQHHHAHVAGCAAEYGLDEPVLGLALDGTGYGLDGSVWGGELLLARPEGDFDRLAHLKAVAMPGGDKAVLEPRRMALSHLLAAGWRLSEAERAAGFKAGEARLLGQMMERGVQSPKTSSMGRLFDAAAAIVLGRGVVSYEAQAAIELEDVAGDASLAEPSMGLVKVDEAGRIDAGELMVWLAEEVARGGAKMRLAASFHREVADGLRRAVRAAREATGVGVVVASGGCLHNRLLAAELKDGLEADGFRFYLPQKHSPGDGGLSYGQIVVAGQRLRAGI